MKKMVITGIICVLIGVAFCGAAYAVSDGKVEANLRDKKVSFPAGGVNKIHIKDHVANVKIYKAPAGSEEIVISAENIIIEEFKASESGGVLTVSYNPRTVKFGVISLLKLNFGKINKMSVINIYIPENKTLDSFYFDGGVGTIYAEYIAAGTVTLDGGVGTSDLNNITAGSLKINGGVGTVKIAGAAVNGDTKIEGGVGTVDVSGRFNGDTVIDGGVGTIDFAGEINGNLKLSTGVGSANISLKGNVDDYNIKADKGVGTIRLNGNKIPDSIKNGGKYDIKIDAGVGSININIK